MMSNVEAVHSKKTVVIGRVLRCSQEEKKLPGSVLLHQQKNKAGGGEDSAHRNVNQKVNGELTPKGSNPR
jgi:hypothetical protein